MAEKIEKKTENLIHGIIKTVYFFLKVHYYVNSFLNKFVIYVKNFFP
jgi:hypothetical protein